MAFQYRPRTPDEWEARINQNEDGPWSRQWDDNNGDTGSGGDSGKALAFLELWQPGGPWQLTAIDPDSGEIETREYSQPQFARKWIGNWQGQRNLYFTVNRTRPGLNKKPAKADISRFAALHVDLDPPKEKGIDLAMVQDDFIDRLKGYRRLPSAIIRTGNGVQAFWLLTETVVVRDEAHWGELEAYNIALEKDLGGDDCHNIDRIMRLPGTINLPTKVKRDLGRVPALVELVFFDQDRRYTLDDFGSAHRQSPNPA